MLYEVITLADRRVVFLGLQLLGVEFLVLGRRVVVARAGARYELDLVAISFCHGFSPLRLDVRTGGAQVGDDLLDAVLVDDAHALVRNTQAHPALLGFEPESLVLQVGQEATTSLVMCVGNA